MHLLGQIMYNEGSFSFVEKMLKNVYQIKQNNSLSFKHVCVNSKHSHTTNP